jgi:hypothetical protein
MEAMRVTGIRLPQATLNRLQTLAHLESLRRGTNITWSELVREVIHEHLLGENHGLAQLSKQGM